MWRSRCGERWILVVGYDSGHNLWIFVALSILWFESRAHYNKKKKGKDEDALLIFKKGAEEAACKTLARCDKPASSPPYQCFPLILICSNLHIYVLPKKASLCSRVWLGLNTKTSRLDHFWPSHYGYSAEHADKAVSVKRLWIQETVITPLKQKTNGGLLFNVLHCVNLFIHPKCSLSFHIVSLLMLLINS